MFAFFGLGVLEIFLLLIIGLYVWIPVVVHLMLRSSNRSFRVAKLEDENRRLRAELDREQDRS
jgi:hypothetical protein